MKKIYIISGCNGAGKTTASMVLFPEILECLEFVNADEIARGISPFNFEKVAITAGKIMLQRIDELIDKGTDFAFETTLSSKNYIKTIQKAKNLGYSVILLYYYINSPQLAIERIKQRVNDGGHNIEDDIIKRRYIRSLNNLFSLYMKEVDFWIFIDNSYKEPEIVSSGYKDKIEIKNKTIWNNILEKI